ncbi:carotenoid oxygenase family protein [Aspergillus lucknowensis]|uniref:Carotenoid oxygenase n=1 Tax=Aspergillus lucknowensis TaxID=176173 RepID=A0ABR4LX23_9EURO
MASTAAEKTSKPPYKNWPNDAAFDASTTSPTPISLRVVGKFPPEVAGTLYRTGPAHYKVDTPQGVYARSHWFDGFSQIHRFQIIHEADPNPNPSPNPSSETANYRVRVLYTSRSQCDDLLEEARRGGNLDSYITFGQRRDPCVSFFQKVKAVFRPADTGDGRAGMANIGVTVRPDMPGSPGGTVTALTDATQMQRLDLETLEPVGVARQSALHPALKGPLSCAHAQYDSFLGDMYNYNLDFGLTATYRVFRTSRLTGKTEVIATIGGAGVQPAYIHSFFLTKNFVVLCVWPLYFNGYGASILWERNIIDAMKFNPDAESKWYVIDRRGGHIATFSGPAFFAFHTVNAFEEENTSGTVDIVCDVIQFPDDSVVRHLYYENVLSTGEGRPPHEVAKPSLVRYRLPRVARDIQKTDVAPVEVVKTVDGVGELPTINPRYATKKHRYTYGIADRGYSSFVDGLAKTDIETGEITYWGREPKPHTPGEAVFIPKANEESEDAGYLLSVVLDGEKGTSYLVCLDARDMTEVARAEFDRAISIGLHGVHVGHDPKNG